MRRAFVVLSVALATVSTVAVSTAAQADVVPASLTGETLIQPGPVNGVTPTTYDCNPSGTSTITITATGTATGPYPGTFTETATAVFGPQAPFGAVSSFTATFSITSAAGTVSGTKTLAPSPSTAVGFCNQFGGQVVLDAAYTATITTPTGSILDQGLANTTQFNICPNTSTCGTTTSAAFYESFLSQQVTPLPPPAPTSADQCKNGGWATYTTLGFKNQGDCVSFVQTHGRNEPGKNNPK